jgi:hypothetical protein
MSPYLEKHYQKNWAGGVAQSSNPNTEKKKKSKRKKNKKIKLILSHKLYRETKMFILSNGKFISSLRGFNNLKCNTSTLINKILIDLKGEMNCNTISMVF